MKVLHIITGLGVGGAERQLQTLLRRLPARCEVVTLSNPGPVAEALRADGVPVTDLGMRGNRDLRALPRLVRTIRRGRYDIVHTHLYRACVYGRPAARLAGVRAVVATEHSLGEHGIEGRPLRRTTRALYRATEKLGALTVAVSPTVAGRLDRWGVPAERIEVIPNAIDPARFRFAPAARRVVRARLGLDPDALVLAGVGRLVPGKRFDLLVRAAARVPQARVVLAGEGPEAEPLRRLAAGLGVADRVRLVGECDGPGVAGLLSAADVFVSCSPEETFGVAVLEALAAGLPAYYAACPAVQDLPPGEAPGARRIDPDPEALAAAVRREAAAGPRRYPVPAAVHRYGVAAAADRLMALYGRLHTAVAAPRPPSMLLASAFPPPFVFPSPGPEPPRTPEPAQRAGGGPR
ncbi:glycosyltransferase [Streptomyces aidingensis]|uniref:D-inositol 3-phosphate glycosyltransferase n=1 Tax=Streptomyces aidingensis TaxID=910347 RepID=A0A1I1QNE8_9ACTN|nr:glycosyltransferase [Streptomyces aidingensis]SFD23522.1 Glycosyltransferase involved in cell wall bisynthesis [Streptomyces aidingensis]